jgi:hypothetical protein
MTAIASRRAILAGATSAIVAAPAALGSHQTQCSYPDLAREFDDIYARWLVVTREDFASLREFDRRVFEATGLQRHEWPLGDPKFRLVLDALHTDRGGGTNEELYEDSHRHLR